MSDHATGQVGERGEYLAAAIRGRGAFRMFKDAIYRLGVADDWFAYKRNRLRLMAAEALSSAGIEYE